MSRATPSLVIRGGTVISAAARYAADVLVVGDRIAAVAEPGVLSADSMLDADGLLVLPGVVDAHVHLRDPGFTHKEDAASATRAAAAGGVTTLLVMPFDDPPADSAAAMIGNAETLKGRLQVDVGLQGAASPMHPDRIQAIATAGATSLEVLLADAPAAIGRPNTWQLREILRAARSAGLVVGVYCEDASLSAGATDRLRHDGRTDPLAHVESKSSLGEQLAISMVGALALDTGASVHLRQVSSAAGLGAARAARAAGARLPVEVTSPPLV
ncbi:MAG: amidohydrolase family protein, partial [Chloroflexota bacterium]